MNIFTKYSNLLPESTKILVQVISTNVNYITVRTQQHVDHKILPNGNNYAIGTYLYINNDKEIISTAPTMPYFLLSIN